MDNIEVINTSSSAIVNNNGKQEIYVWGANDSGQLGLGHTNSLSIPTLLDFSRLGNYISIKEFTNANPIMSVIVNTLEGEQVYVWGSNTSGVLGIGNTNNQSTPVLFNTKQFGDYVYIKNITFSTFGFQSAYSSYAILSTPEKKDRIYVWGANNSGQLGLNDNFSRNTPVLFDTTQFGIHKNIKEFVINNSSYAIIEDNMNNEKLFIWGKNSEGQCATNDFRNVYVPLQLSSSIFNGSKIKFILKPYGTMYMVLTRNGIDELYTWGQGTSGEVGNGTTNNQPSPFRITQSALGGATEIISVNGFNGTYVQARASGSLRLYVWGANNEGQLGVGDKNPRRTPTQLDNSKLGNVTEIYDSSFNSEYLPLYNGFAYVKTSSGDRLYTWGSNDYGQLGVGNTDSNAGVNPNQINSLNLSTGKIKGISQSSYLSFSLTLDRNGQSESYAVGSNVHGQIGNGSTTNVSSFTPILPTRYTNPQPKIMPTPNLTSSQALELINPNNNLVRTELEKYVDTTSFPASATLSIDPATTTSDYKNGILNLGIRTNQYNIPMVLATQTATPKTFNVTIPGFRPVTDVNTNPVSVIIRDADGNNIDKIYDQLVDSTYKVINRDLLEYYFDLSSIPPNAVIHLYRTSFGNDTEATFTLTASQVYGNNGLIVSNQLYVKTDLVWTFTSSQLNLALVISLSVVGGLLLIGAIIAIMLVRRSSNRLII